MKIEEMPRASEGDTIELEGKVFRLKAPNSNDFDGGIVWSQFVILKDSTGEQGCWLKLDSQEDAVTKGTQISIKGKLGKEYTTSRGKKARSINNCDFEVIGKVQAPAESSGQSSQSGTTTQSGTKDIYWEKKFKYEVLRDPKVQLIIVRQTAIKAVTELASSGGSMIKNKKDYYNWADEIVSYIFKGIDLTVEKSKAMLGGETKEETKEERTKKAKDIVGKTEFKPATEKQKNVIFGYRDENGWHKGIIESRYIEKHEIKEIGDPKKLSVEKAGEWITFWWGDQSDPEDIGTRKQREKDNPRDENGKLIGALVKGDKTSLAKDVLIDDINALRRENYLNDDIKFQKEMGYTPNLENLTEEELSKLKGLLKLYNPL